MDADHAFRSSTLSPKSLLISCVSDECGSNQRINIFHILFFICVHLNWVCVFFFYSYLFLQIFGAFLCQRPEQQTSLRRAAHVTACQPQVLLPSSPLHHQDVLAQPPSQAVPQHPHHYWGQSPGPGSPQLLSQWLSMHALHVTFQQNHAGHQQALRV